MKSYFKTILVMIAVLTALSLVLTACFFSRGNGDGSSIKGTYYLFEDGRLVHSNALTIDGATWSANGASGRIEVSGNSITLYSDELGEEMPIYDGTVEDGVITIRIGGRMVYFCLEGKTPKGYTPSSGNGSSGSGNGEGSGSGSGNGQGNGNSQGDSSGNGGGQTNGEPETDPYADVTDLASLLRLYPEQAKALGESLAQYILVEGGLQTALYCGYVYLEGPTGYTSGMLIHYSVDLETLITVNLTFDAPIAFKDIAKETQMGIGFDDINSVSEKAFDPADLEGDTAYIAYNANLKSVTLDYDGGSASGTKMYFEKGKPMSELPSPTKEGYSFLYWTDLYTGETYTASSVMPNRDLTLVASYKKLPSSYSDEYVYLKPANEGVRDERVMVDGAQFYVDKYLYVEITSDDLTGEPGDENNYALRNLEGLEYRVNSGYTWQWYQGDFNTPNGTQRFRLRYGSNIQLITVSDASGVVRQIYLLDIYVRHDYYVSLYQTIYDATPYTKVRVIEGDAFPASTEAATLSGLEYDKRVYYDVDRGEYYPFSYTTAIMRNWSLYQTYLPKRLSVDLADGALDGGVAVTPYTPYATLPIPTRAGYDFLGWKLGDGYFANVNGYAGDKILTVDNANKTLTAVWAAKQYCYEVEGDTMTTKATVPVVTYTDKTMTEILEVVYVPTGADVTLPTKVPATNGYLFTRWLYYPYSDTSGYGRSLTDYTFGEGSLTTPLALAPDMIAVGSGTAVPLNESVTYRESGTYAMYFPADEAYSVTFEATSSYRLTIQPFGFNNNSERTYNVYSGSPLTLTLQVYASNYGAAVASHGKVTFTVSNLYGSFTVKYSGKTANHSGAPLTVNENNLVAAGADPLSILPEKVGYALLGWKENGSRVRAFPDRAVTLTADWQAVAAANDAEAGTITYAKGETANATYLVGDEATVTARTNAGCAWLGWYDGDEKVTEEASYTYTVEEGKTYTAKWSKVTIEKNDDDAGTVTELTETYAVGDEVTVTAATNAGYTWVGWFDGETKVNEGTDLTYTFEMPAESKTYTAKWCRVTLAKNNDDAGTVTELTETYAVGDEIAVTARTNAGYTWVGWFDGETKVSEGTDLTYTFEMPAESKTYTSKWIPCPVTLEKNIARAGTVSGVEGTTAVGGSTTITATSKAGYTWVGWFDGETKVSEGTDLTYTFEMPAEDKSYTAKWELCTDHTFDDNCVCTKCGVVAHTPDDNCVCTKCGAIAHTPDGNCVCTKCGVVAHTPDDNCVCTRCRAIVHTVNENCICSRCGKAVHAAQGNYCRHDNSIYFGEYPQSEVTDASITTALTTAAGRLPTSSNSQQWRSYGYYIESSVSSYMWYIDLFYGGEKYRGVYFTSYRPDLTHHSSSTDNSYQDDNGYSTGNVYWFKYEPIKWRILSESNGEALILCEMIIDSQEYYPSSSTSSFYHNGDAGYTNNYKLSNIRKWLNYTFYNTAFTDIQKQIILLTTVDNSARSTNPNNSATAFNRGTNAYACANTADYVFLLSEQEVTNAAYGFNSSYYANDTVRQKKNTDYAKSQGAWTSTDSSYLGNGSWWLRSPYYFYRDCARSVHPDGDADSASYAYFTYTGVVPALRIRL